MCGGGIGSKCPESSVAVTEFYSINLPRTEVLISYCLPRKSGMEIPLSETTVYLIFSSIKTTMLYQQTMHAVYPCRPCYAHDAISHNTYSYQILTCILVLAMAESSQPPAPKKAKKGKERPTHFDNKWIEQFKGIGKSIKGTIETCAMYVQGIEYI